MSVFVFLTYICRCEQSNKHSKRFHGKATMPLFISAQQLSLSVIRNTISSLRKVAGTSVHFQSNM